MMKFLKFKIFKTMKNRITKVYNGLSQNIRYNQNITDWTDPQKIFQSSNHL